MYATATVSKKTEGKSTARKATRGEQGNVLLRKIDGHSSDSLARLVTTDRPGGCCPEAGQQTSSQQLSRLVQTGRVQAKLKVGKPNDKMEQEADQTADQVMTAPTNSFPASNLIKPHSFLNRQAEEEEAAQAKPLIQRQEDEEEAQAKPLIQRQEEEEEAQAKPLIQRQEEEEEAQAKPLIQRQEEEEAAQAKPLIQRREEEEEAQAKPLIQRQEEEEEAQAKPLIQRQEEEEEAQAKPLIQRREEEEEAQAKPLIQRQEEEEEAQAKPLIQRQEEEEAAQAKPLIQRQEEEEEVQAKPLIQRQEEEEEAQAKTLIQRQEEEEEAQAKPLIQRQEEEEEAQAKPLIQRQEEEEEAQAKPLIQRKKESTANPASDIQQRLNSTKGGGHPLPKSTRSFMEDRFGSDFSNVKVHTDDTAVQMSQEVGAQAFTHGRDIYFNAGKYDPGSSQGRRLLAHELTHTVQQGASRPVKRTAMHSDVVQRQADAAEETMDLEAELAASDAEATAAVDPKPAEQAKKAAETEPPEPKEPEAPEEGKGEKGEKEAGKKKAAPGKPKGAAFVPAKKKKEEAAEKGPTAEFLEQESAAVCGQAAGKAQVLAQNEQTHDDAAEKQKQTDAAVKPPEQEGQAQSNAGQVDGLDQAQAPEPDEKQAQAKMTAEVEKAVPSSIKQLNEFKSKGKAKVVGSKVLSEVKKDTDAVQGTYNEMEKAPPPKPPAQEPQELPPEEAVPETPTLDMGKDAVPQIKAEHTDFTEFDKKSDELLEKEGITDEQLEMVDEGDLAEAKKERQGLKKDVAEQPGMIQEFAQKQVDKVDKDLKQEEKAARGQMRGKRQEGLKASKDKQQKTKTALELKREAVTRQINAIYEKAKTSVTTKLNNLEQSSLKAFDTGQDKASREFEDDVKRDINAFKRKRYSGFWGPAKWLKDKLLGIADFPEVKRAFEKAKGTFVTKIDQLIIDITKAGQKVIKECKDELAGARKQIKTYVDGLGPELKATGQQAMQEMKSKLDEMDKFIDKKKAELAQKLCDKKEEAIKKIDEKIEKMKEEMSGLVSKLGNLLLEAALKFFKWALKKAGYNTAQLMGIINKGKAVIKKIVGDPIGFIGNIIDAVKLGINNFKNNIKKHLIGGLINWLTGAMGDVGIQLPAKFDLKGILSIVLQILGLTWTNIRHKLVKRLGEKVVGAVEKSVEIVKKIITEGPMALWEMIKAKAAEIKAQVMEGIRNWVIVELVKQGIIKLISFLNPAGAIVQAILAIYNTIMFFVENWDRIVTFVKTVFNSIADIAMAKISAAAAAVERALAMTIPIILNFLARLIGLSGIGKTVRNIILKIRKPIDKILNKAINFIVKKAKKLFSKLKKGAAKVKGKIVQWWKARKPFKNKGGEKHTLYIKGKSKKAKLMIASNSGTDIDKYIKQKRSDLKNIGDPAQKSKEEAALNEASTIHQTTKNHIFAQTTPEKTRDQLAADLTKPSQAFAKLTGGVKDEDLPEPVWSPGRGNSGPYKPTVVMADKLSKKKIPKGSNPEDTSVNSGVTGWSEIAAKGLTRVSDKWVQMHLINEGLGGEGKPYNLVPGPNSVNSGSMRTYEDTTKRLVKKDVRNVIWLKTTVSYRSGNRADYASSVKMETGLYVHKGGKEWVKDTKTKLENTSSVPAPVFSAGAVPRLSAPSHTLLSNVKLGNKTYKSVFTQTVVSRIKTVVKEDGAFGTLSSFESKMKAHKFKELTTQTGRDNWSFKLTSIVFPAVRELHANKKLRVR